jgi:hypothetical protein
MAGWRNRHKHFFAPCNDSTGIVGRGSAHNWNRRRSGKLPCAISGLPAISKVIGRDTGPSPRRSSPLDPQQSTLTMRRAQDSLMTAETFAAELDDFPSIAF